MNISVALPERRSSRLAIVHILTSGMIGVGFSVIYGEFATFVARASASHAILAQSGGFDDYSMLEFMGLMLILVPLEELLFRKLAFILLEAEGVSTLNSIVITSLAFGAAHFAGGLIVVALATLAGFLLGWLYSSAAFGLTKCITAHLCINATGYLLMQIFPQSISDKGFALPIWIYSASLLLLVAGVALNVNLNEADERFKEKS